MGLSPRRRAIVLFAMAVVAAAIPLRSDLAQARTVDVVALFGCAMLVGATLLDLAWTLRSRR